MFKLSPMYCGFREYLYGPPVISLLSTPIVFFSPNVPNAQEPNNEPIKKRLMANGSLCFKLGSMKLSKSNSPKTRKFTATKPAINQDTKNCQD